MPVAETPKVAVVPGQLVMLTGAVLTRTFWLTVSVAELVTEAPQVPLTTTE